MQTKDDILLLLKNHRESKAALDMLKLELEGYQGITSSDAIEALTFHHTDGDHVQTSGISDKTSIVAINYANYAKQMNDEARKEIIHRMVELQREITLLDIAVLGLPEEEHTVIVGVYFSFKSISQMAGEMAVTERTIHRYRDTAIQRLLSIYDRYSNLTTGGHINA